MSVTILNPDHWTDKDLANFVRATAKEQGSGSAVLIPYLEYKELTAKKENVAGRMPPRDFSPGPDALDWGR